MPPAYSRDKVGKTTADILNEIFSRTKAEQFAMRPSGARLVQGERDKVPIYGTSAQAPMESMGGGGGLPPWLGLLQMFQGMSGGSQSTRSQKQVIRETNPYRAILADLRRQHAQAGAQTEQNVADIGSWFGQYGDQLKETRRGNRKASKRAGKEHRQLNEGLLSGIADPNVARSLGSNAMNQSGYMMETGANEGRFDRRMEADAGRQAAYQKMVQQRLGAQSQADIRGQMGQVRGQSQAFKAKAMQEMSSGGGDDALQNLFRFLGLVPEEQRLGLLGMSGGEGPGFDTDARSGLGAALGGVEAFYPDPEDKSPVSAFGNFNEMLGAFESAAGAGGFDLRDPQVREAYRQWLAAYVLPKWNAFAPTAGKKQFDMTGSQFTPR